MNWNTVSTALGRIVVPSNVPDGYALFYTTSDFLGRLTPEIASLLTATVREHFGIDSVLTTCSQVHGATVHRASAGKAWSECDSCDALWSPDAGSALGIKVADCLPITMIDPVHGLIANVHSGWRGAVDNIAAETIAAISHDTQFDTAGAYAWLGPSIRACCFEVGAEVVEQFTSRFEDFTRFVDTTHEKPHIDLAGFTADVLQHAGFSAAHIFDSELCTRCDGSIFHSYRRDPKAGGRNLAVVAR
jgi:YfiH family protein